MIASQVKLLKSWLITAMHSVGPSASSWWIARIAGFNCSSMSPATCDASTRGPVRCSPGGTGGTGSPDSQRNSARLRGS